MRNRLEISERSKLGRLLLEAMREGQKPGTGDPAELTAYRRQLENLGTALARHARRKGWRT